MKLKQLSGAAVDDSPYHMTPDPCQIQSTIIYKLDIFWKEYCQNLLLSKRFCHLFQIHDEWKVSVTCSSFHITETAGYCSDCS